MRKAVAILTLALMASASSLFAQERVKNGGLDFEAKLDGWKPGHASFRFADDDGCQAPGCIRFTGPAPAKAVGPTQIITVQPNTDYVLAAAIKGDGKLAPSVRLRGADGKDVVIAGGTRVTVWTPVRVRFNTGPHEKLTLVCVASDEAAPEGSRAAFDDIALLLPSEVPAGQSVQGGGLLKPPGENIALGCKVTFESRPNYGLCTDEEDATQLTDGKYSAGYFWVQKSTVGWNNVSPVTITIDLGKVQPIAGLSYNTAAGVAGVGWPSSILIAVSDDGETWRFVGDLVTLSTKNGLPPADRYAVYRYATADLETRGRYVRVAAAPQGGFTFCDEIEVYRGPESLLAKAPEGEIVTDMKTLAQRAATRSGVVFRLTADLTAAREALKTAVLPDARKRALNERLDAVERAIPQLPEFDPVQFRAVFPLNELHAQILSVRGAVLSTRGLPRVFVWKKNRFDFLTPHEVPEKAPAAPRLAVEMMGNEVRAEDFLLTNASEEPVTLRLRVTGLPGAPRPSWLRVSAVPWTDTSHRVPIAAALPDAEYADGAFAIPVSPGITRRVWLTISSADLKPGQYEGTLVVEGAGQPITVPLRVRVSKITMGRPRLSLGMWDYTDGTGTYGLTPKNLGPAIALQQSHFVDTPWARRSVLPWPDASAFDAQHQLKQPLSFTSFDEWVKRWPNARNYFVFASVSSSFAGAKIGTPEFAGRVGSWAKALAQHMRDLGMKPQQLGILLVDEPHSDAQDEIIAAWARAFKAAAPEITLFQDPTWERPDKTKIQEAITLCDIVCPNIPIFYRGGPEVARYFEARRAAGQKMWFYQCSGPAKLFDPYRYHRLQSWHCFQHGAVGMGFWAFGDTGKALSSWNEYAAAGTPYTPAFIGIDDVTDGIHWQAVREGIEDYEYLSMLRDAAAKTKDAGLKAQAEALLAEAPRAVLSEYSPAYDWKKEADHAVADTYRLRVLALLEKMAQ